MAIPYREKKVAPAAPPAPPAAPVAAPPPQVHIMSDPGVRALVETNRELLDLLAVKKRHVVSVERNSDNLITRMVIEEDS